MVAGRENKVTEILFGDDAMESKEAMELVGRVLDGNLNMEKKGEDFKNFGDETNVDEVADLNQWMGVTGRSTNGVVMRGTVADNGLDEGNPESLGEEAGLNAKQYLFCNGQVPNGTLENMEGIHVNPGLLIPKRRREECVTENEGEYFLSDLVWGKVRSHPWWPGRICEPSAASERVMKYFKKDSYLISYFGGLKLAWNEASKVKPFKMYFCQMEKNSKTEAFCHAVSCALDEVARRVQLGLSCPCLLEVLHDEIESKVVANVGIKKGWSRRDGRDGFSSTVSFLPAEVFQHLKKLAEAPLSRTDRLELVTTKAQLRAFNKWKCQHELPFLKGFGGLFNHDAHITDHGGGRHSLLFPGSSGADLIPSKLKKSIPQDGSSLKSHPHKRVRRASDTMSLSSPTLLNGQKNKIVLSGKKCETVDFQSGDSKVKRRKSLLLSSTHGTTSSQSETYFRDGVYRALKYGDRSSNHTPAGSGEKLATAGLSIPTHGYRISHGKKMVRAEHPPPIEIYSKLCLAAIYPTEGYGFSSSIVNLLCEFRNSICLGKYNVKKHKTSAWNPKEKQRSISETTDTFGLVDTEDYYWKDMVIQNFSEDRVLFEAEIPTKKNPSAAEPEPEPEPGPGPGPEPEAVVGTGNKQESIVILDSETENPSCLMDEKSEEYSPIALILTFTNVESIPSIINLNEIFSHYGPLNESETEVLSKSKRAKVFFKRRADAETVFNNRGLFGIFGSTLVSYRLKFYCKPAEALTISKQKKKTHW